MSRDAIRRTVPEALISRLLSYLRVPSSFQIPILEAVYAAAAAYHRSLPLRN